MTLSELENVIPRDS